ncbi:hypothetical protein FRC10_004274 [Ceratobasidium sp. 414]|nr:hypothetical protein FRC10_004274 [Ceratobasidium sp. 414]
MDEVIQHDWEGNLKPPVYHTNGTHNQEAEAALPDPPLLKRPRKFLIYVQYKLHQTLLNKVLQIRGRGLVEYDRTMSKAKHAAGITNNVGATGPNLTAASIVIFVSSVWSGQERKQIIGRMWQYGQLAEVIIIDIFTPQGLDLMLAGYASAKTIMSDIFLRAEQDLHRAHKAITEHECQRDLGKDEEDEEEDKEDRDDALPPDLPQPKKSQVAKCKHKTAAAPSPSAADSDNDEPVAPLAKKAKSKPKTAKSNNPNEFHWPQAERPICSRRSINVSAPSRKARRGTHCQKPQCDAGPSKLKVWTSKLLLSTLAEQPAPEPIVAGPSKQKQWTPKASSSALAEQLVPDPTATTPTLALQPRKPSGGASSSIGISCSSSVVLPLSPAPHPASSGSPPPMSSPSSERNEDATPSAAPGSPAAYTLPLPPASGSRHHKAPTPLTSDGAERPVVPVVSITKSAQRNLGSNQDAMPAGTRLLLASKPPPDRSPLHKPPPSRSPHRKAPTYVASDGADHRVIPVAGVTRSAWHDLVSNQDTTPAAPRLLLAPKPPPDRSPLRKVHAPLTSDRADRRLVPAASVTKGAQDLDDQGYKVVNKLGFGYEVAQRSCASLSGALHPMAHSAPSASASPSSEGKSSAQGGSVLQSGLCLSTQGLTAVPPPSSQIKGTDSPQV